MKRLAGALALAAAAAMVAHAREPRVRAQQVSQGPGAPGIPPAQQPPPQTPTFRAGVNFVSVDVLVTDRDGKPVGDLDVTDFVVTEAGKPQQIETFRRIDLDGGRLAAETPHPILTDEDERREASRNDVRVFAVFLDDFHVKRASALRNRGQIANFVDNELGPSDMVAVMHPMDPVARVRATRNHDVIRNAIQQFEGRKHDYFPKDDAEAFCVYRLLQALQVEEIERMRNRTSFEALQSLITYLGGLKEGRKSLILVSEGYSRTLPSEMRDYAGGLALPLQSTATAPPQCLGSSRDMNIDIQDIFDLANRNNVAIYSVDPRGLAATEYGMDLPDVRGAVDRQYLMDTQNTLRTLSEGSDGRAIINRNDLALAMKPIVVDAGAYYLLGYGSNMAAPDGKFHPIDVKVKRPGLQVRHRPGYWAIKPDEATRLATPAPAPAVSPIDSALAGIAASRNRPIRTWVGTARGANGSTRLTFVWEPAPGPSGDARRPVRVSVAASRPDGTSYFRGRVPESAGAIGSGAMVSFDVSPGAVELRLSVEDASGSTMDSEVRALRVPDLTGPRSAFGTPEVFRARTPADVQRLMGTQGLPPAAAREFSRTERLLLRAQTYGPAVAALKVRAQLLNRQGQALSELPVSQDQQGLAQVELPLANLSPADYGVQFTGSSAAGDVTELVAFRVTP